MDIKRNRIRDFRMKEIYEELSGYQDQLKSVHTPNSYDSALWELLNGSISELNVLSGTHTFDKYKITPQVRFDGNFYISVVEYKIRLSGILSLLKSRYLNQEDKPEKKSYQTRTATLDTPSTLYIKEEIIEGFRNKKDGFNYKKLIGLINELNKNYIMSNPYSCLSLVRAITDHIPPLLGFGTFEELLNNYRGSKTDKNYLAKLFSDRPVSDDTLHRPISKSEDLIDMGNVPNKQFLNRLLQECLDNSVKAGFQHKKEPKHEKKGRVIDPNLRPVLQAAITSLSGSSQGYVASFDIKNAGKGLAILKGVMLGDVAVPIREATLGEGEQAKGSVNIEGSELRKGNIKSPKLEINYENINKDKFLTKYEVKLQSRADGLFNIESFANPDFGI